MPSDGYPVNRVSPSLRAGFDRGAASPEPHRPVGNGDGHGGGRTGQRARSRHPGGACGRRRRSDRVRWHGGPPDLAIPGADPDRVVGRGGRRIASRAGGGGSSSRRRDDRSAHPPRPRGARRPDGRSAARPVGDRLAAKPDRSPRDDGRRHPRDRRIVRPLRCQLCRRGNRRRGDPRGARVPGRAVPLAGVEPAPRRLPWGHPRGANAVSRRDRGRDPRPLRSRLPRRRAGSAPTSTRPAG